MKNQINIVKKSYLRDSLINNCLPTTYDDKNRTIFQNMSVVSTCFIWGYILWLCKPQKSRIL